MKKILTTLICLLLVFGATNISAFAMDAPDDEIIDQNENNQNQETRYYHEELPIRKSDQRPAYIPYPRTRASLVDDQWNDFGVARYYQDDYTKSVCSGGGTIAQYGCTITSFAMNLARYNVYRNPEQVFDDLLHTGGILANCEMTWNASSFSRAYPGMILEHWKNGPNYLESEGMKTIEKYLKYTYPVIVGMKNPTTSKTHYVLCIGFERYSDGGAYHYTFNPQRGKAETIEGYMASWYIMDFTVLYRNW